MFRTGRGEEWVQEWQEERLDRSSRVLESHKVCPDAGKDQKQKEKGAAEDEMVRRHH